MIDAGPYTEIVEYAQEHAPKTWSEIVIRVELNPHSTYRYAYYEKEDGRVEDLHYVRPFSPEEQAFFDMMERLRDATSQTEGHWLAVEFRMLPDGEYKTKFFFENMAFVQD